jgi:hypothetical protein
MDGKKACFILAAALTVIPTAFAEKSTDPPLPAAPQAAAPALVRSSPMINRSLSALPLSAPQLQGHASLPSSLTLDSRDSLHWAPDGDHPALEYKLNDTSTLRLRGNRGGAKLVVQWKF